MFCFTISRFTAVCNPYKFREKNANTDVLQSVLKILVPIIIFSVLLNIPRFYETVIVNFVQNVTTVNNATVLVETITYDVTPLRMNPDYIR